MTSESRKLSLAERVYILSKTYAAIQMYFAHWQAIPDFDLDAAYQQTLETALRMEDRRDFGLEMMAFLSQLRNGNTQYIDPWMMEKYGQPLGFIIAPYAEGWAVTESHLPALSVGDIIEDIEKQTTDYFFLRNKKYVGASSEREAHHRFASLRLLLPLRFTMRLSTGRYVEIDRTKNEAPTSKVEGRWLKEDKVGYIRIPSFAKPEYEQTAIKHLREFKDAHSIIMDVRGNAGGATPLQLVEALMERPFRFWTESTCANYGLFRANHELLSGYTERLTEQYRGFLEASKPFAQTSLMWPSPYRKPRETIFSGKLIILTDGWTASAAEDFVVPFKDNGRATIIGDTTMGSTGQPYVHSFDNGIRIMVGTKRAYLPDGAAFEGIGIQPDIVLRPGIIELRTRRGLLLERALGLVGG